MINRLAQVTILVRDHEEALKFYTEKLDLEKCEDDSTTIHGFRWLTIAPKDQKWPEIVLLKPGPPFQDKQTAEQLLTLVGKNPTWVFQTDNCHKTYETLRTKGVKFLSPPEQKPYGTEAIFEDLYGNKFSLLEPR